MFDALKRLPGWEQECSESADSIADAVTQDSTSAQIVAKLAGAMQKAQGDVSRYMRTFESYSFLWMKDLATEYAAFLATKPELEVASLSSDCFLRLYNSMHFT